MIYLGIDDTDIVGSPGTNQLARVIVRRLGSIAKGSIVCRHQLFFDPRVPYTSGNGSASIQLPHGDEIQRSELISMVRDVMHEWYVEGSDPGLAVATTSSPQMEAFANRAKCEVVMQAEARTAAAASGCYLEGLGGTNQGIIGALAAIALVAGGNDGRVVHLEQWPWPDQFSGVQPVGAIRERGVDSIRVQSGDTFTGDVVDVGKHLRPNWRSGSVVLFVEPPPSPELPWRAMKLDGRSEKDATYNDHSPGIGIDNGNLHHGGGHGRNRAGAERRSITAAGSQERVREGLSGRDDLSDIADKRRGPNRLSD